MFNRERLVTFMEFNDLRAPDLAKAYGVSPGLIRNIMSGVKQPSLAMTVDFSKLIGCSMDDLVIR